MTCTPRQRKGAGFAALISSTLLATTLLSPTIPILGNMFFPEMAIALNTNEKNKTNNKQVASASPFAGSDSGALNAVNKDGKTLGQCPLAHTDVQTEISGYIAKVTVKQKFQNKFKENIEAVYTFPLSEKGAVNSMTMKIGDRIIKGDIKKKQEAKEIYENAKNAGQTAALLDQERPNIFTQSVANIKPGQDIDITITYVELLSYESGKYTFAFPTVVGPRFNPGTSTGKSGTGWANDTNQVPDASRITPPVTPKGTRSGHDISISVNIDAGVPINNISSKLHQVAVNKPNSNRAHITLSDQATIPNKDFVLTYDVASDQLKSGYLTHADGKEGYVNIMILPPKRVTPQTAQPKEMVFLIDCSGSQSGAPLEKAKETLKYIVEHMNPNDTFQILSFNNGVTKLFDKPKTVSPVLKIQALAFINGLHANGGTWMGPAVEEACKIPSDQHRLRIVTFMTDGYVGNDMEILGMIRRLRGLSRWFSFGTGNSVNRYLIDGMAKEGGGEADYVLLNTSGEEVGKKFYNRISSPVLTDVKVSFDGVEVDDVFPKTVSDVWAEKPLYITGHYTKAGKGTATITGYSGGKPYLQKLAITLPLSQPQNDSIGSIWARSKVDWLMSHDLEAAQRGQINKELEDEIVKVALKHHILTQYTSFVAVEEKTEKTKSGKIKTVTVPVEMPDGVSYEGVFGEQQAGAMSTDKLRKVKRYAGKSQSYAGSSGNGGSYSLSGSCARGGGAGKMYATAPCPMPTVANGPTSSPTLYKAPRQLQVVDEKPTVKDYRKQNTRLASTQAKEESMSNLGQSTVAENELKKADMDSGIAGGKASATKPNAAQLAKLDAKLKNLIQDAQKQNESVLVKIKVSKLTEAIVKQLNKLGFTLTAKDFKTNTLEGKVEIAKLAGLLKLKEILKIEKTL